MAGRRDDWDDTDATDTLLATAMVFGIIKAILTFKTLFILGLIGLAIYYW